VTSDRKWDPLLVFVAIYLLTVVGRVHQLFTVVGLVRPAIVAGLGAIILFILDTRVDRQLRLVMIRPVRFLLLFLGWMTLSMTVALVIGNSFALVVNNFVKTVVMSIIVAAAIRGVRDVERLALVYLASVTIYSAIVVAVFDPNSATGRLGDLYYYDVNDFATLVVTALPIGLYFFHASRRGIGRVAAVISLAILALAFVKTGSRGGFVAALAVGLFVVVRYRTIPLSWRIGATALVTVVVMFAAGAQYWARMGTILSEDDYNRTHPSGRFQIWERGLGYMMRFPLLGVGPANFQTAEGTLSELAEKQQYGVGIRWNAAHNSYVQVGAETGLPGLFFFLGMIVTSFLALRTVQRRAAGRGQHRIRELANALTGALVGFSVGAFFLSLAYTEMLYALIALTVGLYKATDLMSSARRTT
jgi:O-antigen ligase